MLILLVLFVGPASASSRVALVIGNADYDHVPKLANPLNDAADVGAALGRLEFSVTHVNVNAGFDALRKELRTFRRAASAAEIAVVFYAGHGIEVDKQNFLVPMSTPVLQTDGEVGYEAVPLEMVTGAVEGASNFSLVMLDACRDNPFRISMRREKGSTRSIGRGLARPKEPSGDTLIVYSAKEGTTATDGTGLNSPFASALLRYLEEPGLEVGIMFRHVSDAVEESTGQDQEPVWYGSLPSKGAYFIPPGATQAKGAAPVTASSLALLAESDQWGEGGCETKGGFRAGRSRLSCTTASSETARSARRWS